MKKIIVIILTAFLIHTCFFTLAVAQEGTVKVLVRQVGTSTYSYKVINLRDNPISSIMIGYNRNLERTDIEESELTLEPTKISSPKGWVGEVIFVEGALYLHIDWRVSDFAYTIPAGGSLDGFIVEMPQSYDMMKKAYFTVIYSAGTRLWDSAKVQIDNDNDGYPVGEDCNDNDPLEHPNQTWYKDADGDGYSSGNIIVQCLRPANYKVASELTSTSGDCDDSNAAVHPGAIEICNDGIDNNCNGLIDSADLVCAILPDLTGQWTSMTVKQVTTTTGIQWVVYGNLQATNQGNADAGAFVIKCYFVPSGVGSERLLSQRSLLGLLRGATTNASFRYPYSSNPSNTGSIRAVIDADNTVTESNEANNEAMRSIP